MSTDQKEVHPAVIVVAEVSLWIQSQSFSDECVGTEDRKGSSRERKRNNTIMPTLEVLWRSFEEDNLVDSSGSNFEVGVESGGEDNPTI